MNDCQTILCAQPHRRFLRATAALALSAALVSGCHRPQARTVPEMPALDVPQPPPRNVEPIDAQVPQPIPLVDVPARTVELPRVASPTPPRDPARIEPKPDAPPEPIRAPEEAKPAATTLQTTPTDREAELDRRVRAALQAAMTDLNRIDYRKLNPDVQLQYDTAKSFVRQAEEALKSKNLVFAQTMAEKAGTLASQLAGR